MNGGSFDPGTYIDRELGWLEFNSRVLSLAENVNIPLAERITFLTISATNFDDFFMIRVAGVKTEIEARTTRINTAGFSPRALFEEIMDRARKIAKRQSGLLEKSLLPELAEQHIHLISYQELSETELVNVKEYFDQMVFPILTPLVVDPSHPFPYISGLSLNLAVILTSQESQNQFFARVKVPPFIPRFYELQREKEKYFLSIEDIIGNNLKSLFPGATVLDYFVFRITRNQDIEVDEDDSANLLESIEQEIQQRRFGPPVRLELPIETKENSVDILLNDLGITADEIIRTWGPLDYSGLLQIRDAVNNRHRFSYFTKKMPKLFSETEDENPENLFSKIKKSEIFLHHPYDSFNRTVVRLLQTAAVDPQVLAIKQTLYRTSGDSPIVDALIEAAESGKQVLAVIELRARFDELANVRWARKLENAGVHVVYGLMGLKTHAKLSLIVRQEGTELVRYCHIGTGNYNPKTADIYEDYGLISSDKELGQDLSKIFNQLSGFVVETKFNRLLVAPKSLRSGLIERIDREIRFAKLNKPASLCFKLNALIDEQFVEKLYEASLAGVQIKLIVRGACSVVPGILNLSENIRVRSLVGRFLEHSRVYSFHNDGDHEIYVGSADLMERNLDRRVEALVRIKDQSQIYRILSDLDKYWSDQIHCFEMNSDTTWNEINRAGKYLHSELLKGG